MCECCQGKAETSDNTVKVATVSVRVVSRTTASATRFVYRNALMSNACTLLHNHGIQIDIYLLTYFGSFNVSAKK